MKGGNGVYYIEIQKAKNGVILWARKKVENIIETNTDMGPEFEFSHPYCARRRHNRQRFIRRTV